MNSRNLSSGVPTEPSQVIGTPASFSKGDNIRELQLAFLSKTFCTLQFAALGNPYRREFAPREFAPLGANSFFKGGPSIKNETC